MNLKVLIGMSGGVDSSVSALILKEKGYEVIGATMKMIKEDKCSEKCCSSQAILDAKKVCDGLEIPHYILNCEDEFKKRVVDQFVNCYKNAKTPNPCVECNQYLKFGEFYKSAKELGCKYIATGHYAKVEYCEEYEQYVLKKASEERKDQSYFLYRMPKEVLPYIIFPLEEYKSKEEIRKIAQDANIPVANKKESQEICFIPNDDYVKFIKETTKINYKPGNIVTTDRKKIGKHNGIINYTVGQRKGLGVSYKEPLYVLKIDKDKNEIIVGTENELYTNEVIIEDINCLISKLEGKNIKVDAKIRYKAKPAKAQIYYLENNMAKLVFEEPQRAVTPGQSVVLYIDDIVVGGGKIV